MKKILIIAIILLMSTSSFSFAINSNDESIKYNKLEQYGAISIKDFETQFDLSNGLQKSDNKNNSILKQDNIDLSLLRNTNVIVLDKTGKVKKEYHQNGTIISYNYAGNERSITIERYAPEEEWIHALFSEVDRLH